MLNNLLVGKSEEQLKSLLQGKSYEDVFDMLSELILTDSITNEEMYDLNAINYDNKIFFCIIEPLWDDSITLKSYGIAELKASDIAVTLYKTINEYYKSYFHNDIEEYNGELPNLEKAISNLDTLEYNEIDDLVFDGGEFPISIYYKKNGIITVLDDNDRLLDCLK